MSSFCSRGSSCRHGACRIKRFLSNKVFGSPKLSVQIWILHCEEATPSLRVHIAPIDHHAKAINLYETYRMTLIRRHCQFLNAIVIAVAFLRTKAKVQLEFRAQRSRYSRSQHDQGSTSNAGDAGRVFLAGTTEFGAAWKSPHGQRSFFRPLRLPRGRNRSRVDDDMRSIASAGACLAGYWKSGVILHSGPLHVAFSKCRRVTLSSVNPGRKACKPMQVLEIEHRFAR